MRPFRHTVMSANASRFARDRAVAVEDNTRVADPEAHPVGALLDLPGVDPGGPHAHQNLSGSGPRVLHLANREHLAGGTAAFVPGSAHPEASSFAANRAQHGEAASVDQRYSPSS
jgi:hypothetical protein